MTTSSLRLAKWLAEYAALMRLIGSEAGRVWSGMAELFELYFLHIFHTFGDITILELTSPQVQRQVSAPVVVWWSSWVSWSDHCEDLESMGLICHLWRTCSDRERWKVVLRICCNAPSPLRLGELFIT